jgi:hypothetical protein
MRLLLRASRVSQSTISRAAGVFFSSRVSMAISGKALAISDAKDQNYQTIAFDLADEPVVAHAIFPELPKPRAVRRLSNAAWVVQLGNRA